MSRSFLSTRNLLILLIMVSAFLRFFRLDYPNAYVFDEVYHAYTAKEYLKANKDAWSPWGKSPPGVAFEWLHPPIAKELMTASMFVFKNTDAWAWRIPGALLGTLSVFLVFKLGQLLFKNNVTALISAFVFSVDGLVFVQSRTGMNDAYLVAFILVSVIFFVQKRYLLSALFMGIACATKWPGVFLYAAYLPLLLYQKNYHKLPYFIFIPPIIYLLSYLPYFLSGYQISDFIELHKQIWWYQTNLKATHDYASPWWSWPLNLYPVWYFVDYHKDGLVSNIFASGNPVVFWMGSGAILVSVWDGIKAFVNRQAEKSKELFISLCITILGFLCFWLPWSISPRIMFLYHFSPSVPFLSLALGYQLSSLFDDQKSKWILFSILGLIALTFILLYPMLTGIPLSRSLMLLFFKTNLTKNPFG